MNRVAVFFTLTIILASLAILYTVSHWQLPQPATPAGSLTKTWVLLQPVTCQELPWRSEWARTNQKSYAEFPTRQERALIRVYYQDRGITVLNVSLTYQPTDATCTRCGCPERFVYGIQTYAGDAAKLSASGFNIVDNSDPRIFTGPLFRQSTDQPISNVSEADCDQLFSTQTALDEILGSRKDSCYVQAAIGARNIDICAKIHANAVHTNCITEVATALKYADACDLLNEPLDRDACLAGVAGALGDVEICVRIIDPNTRYFCELGAQEA